jgi:hypothetical protein
MVSCLQLCVIEFDDFVL